MNHRGEHKLQFATSKVEAVAILHLQGVLLNTIESLHHSESLLVADNGNLGIILADELDGSTVVGLHMVDYQVVYLAVAKNLLDILDIRYKEIHLYGIDEADLLVVNEIRVIRYSIRKWPQSFK